MGVTSKSQAGRLLAIAALTLGAIPMLLTWRASAPAPQTRVLDWPAPAGQQWVSANEIEAQLHRGEGTADLAGLSRLIGAPLTWNSRMGQETEIAHATLPAGAVLKTALAALRADSRVKYAGPVHYYGEPEDLSGAAPAPVLPPSTRNETGGWKPNDPRYSEQWNFRMVKAEQAWEVTRGKGVTVAVIDTGVAYADTRKGRQAKDFGSTRFVKGYDFCNKDDLPNDDHGHGTHVAGTIAESTNNGEGVAGLAFDASIMPVKVLTATGMGRSTDIAEAIRFAADHGATVINMSLGGPYPDRLMESACQYAHDKGVTIVCAAGNSAREGVGYPAAFPECIAVSAVGPRGDLSFYSSWGRQVAIAAPGGDKQQDPVNGGILQNTLLRDPDSGAMVDDYYAFQGTSMASPHVAAVAAMVQSLGVRNPDNVKAVLQKSAARKGPSNKYGAGVLDAASAVKLTSNLTGDNTARVWFVALLIAGCVAIGRLRQRAGSRLGYPVLGTVSLAAGLLFPDWLTHMVGLTSRFNLIGHSVLIPGILLITGAEEQSERRALGWIACGMALHVGWEFLRGTSPVSADLSVWRLLPWVAANVLVGFGMLLSSFTRRKP
ncbi:MAG TPA: S8 family peptidase [Chthonomonadales bacterium]|nr:S8 family peptidase [Chthonomonadales bacterium]